MIDQEVTPSTGIMAGNLVIVRAEFPWQGSPWLTVEFEGGFYQIPESDL